MPTYEYVCTACGHRLEVVQGFADEPLERCEVCGGKLRRVFHPVGVMFKGSGFYSTDSRSSKRSKAADAARGDGTSTKTDSESTKSSSKSEAQPEAQSGAKSSSSGESS